MVCHLIHVFNYTKYHRKRLIITLTYSVAYLRVAAILATSFNIVHMIVMLYLLLIHLPIFLVYIYQCRISYNCHYLGRYIALQLSN